VRNAIAGIAAALILACAPATARARWSPAGFQVGGYLYAPGVPGAGALVALDEAGLDWVLHWNDSTTRRQARLTAARIDSLRLARPGWRMKAVLAYGLDDDAQGDDGAGRLLYNVDHPLDSAAVLAALASRSGLVNSSVLGWLLWDEPCDSLDFVNVGWISRLIEASPAARDRLPLVNLLPAGAFDAGGSVPARCQTVRLLGAGAESKRVAYATYLERYLSCFDAPRRPPPLLCFASYPFQVADRPRRDYFLNLQVVRDAAARHVSPEGRPVPFWTVVQLGPFRPWGATGWSSAFSPARTRWQVYCALAYGAKGIAYWGTAPFPNPPHEDWGAGILTAVGDTVAVAYSWLRALNAELHRLGPTLMRLDPVECVRGSTAGWEDTEHERLGAPGRPAGLLADAGPASRQLLAGHLRDRERGDDYLLLVNTSLSSRREFAPTLAAVADSIFRIDRGSGRPTLVGVKTRRLPQVALVPGQGELYRIVR
jgi:hypothetical protein